jgi:predicted RNase H-like HicB family nuclease
MRRTAIGIEKTKTGFSVFVPDLLGCVPTGRNKAEVEPEMKDAIRFHIDGMMEDGM